MKFKNLSTLEKIRKILSIIFFILITILVLKNFFMDGEYPSLVDLIMLVAGVLVVLGSKIEVDLKYKK
jgi:hypothetical protein